MMTDLPERPLHPVHALTTYELSGYRRELEHALKHLPDHAPVRELLRQRLDAVLSEESARQSISEAI
jgi:hypothetical protein